LYITRCLIFIWHTCHSEAGSIPVLSWLACNYTDRLFY
jgi:hypothetical protein